jgi:hypothetical protein
MAIIILSLAINVYYSNAPAAAATGPALLTVDELFKSVSPPDMNIVFVMCSYETYHILTRVNSGHEFVKIFP